MDKEAKWKKEFGTRLREARELRSMPVADILAYIEKLGPQRSRCRDSLNHYENGVTTPKFPDTILICRCLKISPDWLFDGSGSMEA